MSKPTTPPRPFSPLDGLSPSSLTTRHPAAHPPAPTPRPVNRSTSTAVRETTIRTRMEPDDKRRVESLCVRLSESLRATVRPSNLLRALLVLVRDTEASLHAEARRVHGLERPSNNDRVAMGEFEGSLAAVLLDGFAANSSRRP